MEDKKLNRVFDRVKLSRAREEAILADLLREKKEVSSMKQTVRRRIPAAALAAAVLTAALVGTALAAEYFGRVRVTPQESSDFTEEGGMSYTVSGEYDHIPAEILSEEVRALAGEAALEGCIARTFQSRRECEEFLGIMLPQNSLLEQLPGYAGIDMDGDRQNETNSVRVYYSKQMPTTIFVDSCVGSNGCSFTESVILRTEYYNDMEHYDMQVDIQGGASFERYVTPGGMEVTISAASSNKGYYNAHFAINNALFELRLFARNDLAPDGSNALDALKEILDAYE